MEKAVRWVCMETGTAAKLYFDTWKQYLKDGTLYFSTGLNKLSKKTPPAGGTASALTNGQADNFVFAPDGIYFRLHSKGSNAYYGIVRAPYNAVPQGSGGRARLKDSDMKQIAAPGTAGIDAAADPKLDFRGSGDLFSTLNVSRDFIAYMRRGKLNILGTPEAGTTGLGIVHPRPGRVHPPLKRFAVN